MDKGHYNKGEYHDKGGIKQDVKETGEIIEVEKNEYIICKSVFQSQEQLSYTQKTNLEILHDIYSKGCDKDGNTVNSGDFIICKVVVMDKTLHDRSGTVKEILNQMQSEKSCRVENGGDKFFWGGTVNGWGINLKWW